MTKRLLRPLGLGDIFDEAFDLYKGSFLFLLLVTAVAAVPLKIALGLVEFRFLRDFHGIAGLFGGDLPDITQVVALFGTIAGSLAILAPLYAVGLGLQLTALASASSSRYLNQPSSLWSAYLTSLRRIGPLTLSALLCSVLLALGACVCYLGLAVPLTLLAFSAHAFAVENCHSWRFWQPLVRSRTLVAGQAGRVFGALCIMGIVYLILSIGIQLPLDYALRALLNVVPGAATLIGAGAGSRGMSTEAQVISQVGDGITDLIVLPFLACVLTVLYYDLRVRKEAFDIGLLARDLHYDVLPWVTPSARRQSVPQRPTSVKGTLS